MHDRGVGAGGSFVQSQELLRRQHHVQEYISYMSDTLVPNGSSGHQEEAEVCNVERLESRKSASGLPGGR